MTACVNRKHTKKVAAVVTASLVGALSLGAAPVAAMADTGIETLALSGDQAFKSGTLTGVEDNNGRSLEVPADGIVLVGNGKFVVPTEITPKDGEPVAIYTSESGATSAQINARLSYHLGFGGTGATPTSYTPGRYSVVVTMNDDPSYTYTVNFIVEESANLADAVVFDNFDGTNNTADTTFTWNSQKQKFGVAVGDKVLRAGTDYNVTVVQTKDGRGNVTGTTVADPTSITDAGTYEFTITGATSSDYAGQTKKVTVVVNRLNLANAEVSIDDQKVSVPTISEVKVNGIDLDLSVYTAIQAQLTSYAQDASGNPVVGKCEATVSSIDGANIVASGAQTIQFNLVDNVIDDTMMFYGTDSFASDPTQSFNLSDGLIFKASRISVKDAATGGSPINSAYYTITYVNAATGEEVDASALQNPGVYKVNVRVNAEASHYTYGSGTETLTVVVTKGTVNASSDIVFRYDGKVDDDFTVEYDGSNFLDKLETIVRTDDGEELEAGTDYTVKAYNKDTDEQVDQIVDAGDYKVVIEIAGYGSIPEAQRSCDVTVDTMDLEYGIYVNGGDLTSYTWDDGFNTPWGTWVPNLKTVWYLGYTGDVIEPALEFGYYTDENGDVAEYNAADASDLTWNALPEGSVTVTGYMFTPESGNAANVDSVKGEGDYKVQFALENANYEIDKNNAHTGTIVDDGTTNVFTVSSDRVAFADVDPDEWYAESVFQAKQLGYIKGIQGSNLYAPNAAITRADALVIISRMAGADTELTEDWLSQNSGYVTRYSDVDPGAYYAKAVAWATKVGVVHGYGDGTFRPDAQITREEFAAYLANYAEAMGKDISVDTDAVLAEFPDGSQVSDWAEGVVAWAADSDIMGNGGVINPQSQITRAEVAAMAVNYQPDGISSGVIG